MLRERRIWLPWIASALLMFGMSYLWHGVALNDLHELRVPIALYLTLSALAYLIIGLGITVAVHQCIQHHWISLRQGFPLKGMLVGSIIGFVVFLLAFLFGMSFTDHAMMHLVVDVLWQMAEQSIGGLAVALGIIYDLHQNFLEHERGR
jgi:hypothetical protein